MLPETKDTSFWSNEGRGKDGGADPERAPCDVTASLCEGERTVSARRVGAGVGRLEDLETGRTVGNRGHEE